MTSPRIPPGVNAEAERMERALKEARIPIELQDGIWDIWVASPARAYHMIERFKVEAPVKTKAAAPPGIIDQALARLGAACRERARMDGDQPIADYLDKITANINPPAGTVGGSLGDSEKAVKTRKENTDMATKRQRTTEIFLTLDPPAQQRIIAAVSQKGWDAAYDVALALLHNQPLPPATVKEAPQKTPSDGLGDLLSGAAQSQRAVVQRGQNIIAEHQGEHDHRWWK